MWRNQHCPFVFMVSEHTFSYMYNSEVKDKYSYLTCRLITGEEKVKYRNFVNPFLRYALSVAIESEPLEVSSS